MVSATTFERIIAPNAIAKIYGEHLDKVTSLTIGGKVVTDIHYNAGDKSISYSVPADLASGEYRLLLGDAEGNGYGADKVTVSEDPLVTSGASRATASVNWTINGINLDKIVSLSIGGHEVNTFVAQSSTALTFVCPTLADGEYTLTGKTANGKEVKFYVNNAMGNQQKATISTEISLWSGHHYVSWDEPDSSPNKLFSAIGTEQLDALSLGTTLYITYSLKPDDSYHQLQVMTSWWNLLPGTSKIEMNTNGVYELVLTQEIINKIKSEGGFRIAGHGFYVDRISAK